MWGKVFWALPDRGGGAGACEPCAASFIDAAVGLVMGGTCFATSRPECVNSGFSQLFVIWGWVSLDVSIFSQLDIVERKLAKLAAISQAFLEQALLSLLSEGPKGSRGRFG